MAVDYKELKNSGFMQQIQKDRFSLRLKVVGGNLTAGQLATIAKISEDYGNGYVHLTSRQGVEIPFIRLEDVDAVKAALLEGDVFTGACGATVRTVTACQGQAICTSGCIDTYPLAKEISERYFKRSLPHKFKIGITGCQNNCLKAEENDLGIKGVYQKELCKEACILCGACVKACRRGALSITENTLLLEETLCNDCGKCVKVCPVDAWKGTSAYLLSFGGTFGNRIVAGESFLPTIRDKDILFRVADAALTFFDEHGQTKERLRFVIERTGWDTFQEKIEQAYKGEYL